MSRIAYLTNGKLIAAGLLFVQGAMASAAEPTEPPVEPTAQAQQSAQAAESAASATTDQAASKKWQFATIGYAWLAGAKGKTDVIGPVPPVDLDLSFGDALKALKFAFEGAAEARRDRVVVLGDLTFIHLDAKDGIGIRDPDFLEAELDSKTAEITLVGGYRVVNKESVTIDLLAGGRMNFFKTTLDLEGPNRSAKGSVTKNWFDPLLATRIAVPLGGKWGLSIYGDIGGFGIGSDLTWQGIAGINYRISRKFTLGAGWRYFKVNYDDGPFLYDVAQSGPILTFRTEF